MVSLRSVYDKFLADLGKIGDSLEFDAKSNPVNPSDKICDDCLDQLLGKINSVGVLMESTFREQAIVEAHQILEWCVLHKEALGQTDVFKHPKVAQVESALFG